jgi:hypothetical protein
MLSHHLSTVSNATCAVAHVKPHKFEVASVADVSIECPLNFVPLHCPTPQLCVRGETLRPGVAQHEQQLLQIASSKMADTDAQPPPDHAAVLALLPKWSSQGLLQHKGKLEAEEALRDSSHFSLDCVHQCLVQYSIVPAGRNPAVGSSATRAAAPAASEHSGFGHRCSAISCTGSRPVGNAYRVLCTFFLKLV